MMTAGCAVQETSSRKNTVNVDIVEKISKQALAGQSDLMLFHRIESIPMHIHRRIDRL